MKNYLSRREKGMTFVELMTSMAILAIVMTGVSSFFVYLWRAKSAEVSKASSAVVASNSVYEMTKQIREATQAESGAYFVAYGDDLDITFYSDIDDDGYTEKVRYYLDGTILKVAVAEPILGINPTYSTEWTITNVAENVVNDSASEPIFTYYDFNGDLMTTSIDIYSVRSIRVTIVVNSDPGRIQDVEISSLVALRNYNI